MRSMLAVRRALAMSAVAVLAGVAACSDDDATGPNEDIIASIQTDAQIMAAMHESNVGEIAAGQVALNKASDAEVREFAEMMIDHHTDLDQQGMALATQLGITPILPDQRLPQLQEEEMQTLSATPAGVGFDRVYIAQQITAHVRTLELVEASIDRADRAEIRAMLVAARPIIESHLELAESIQDDIGMP
jgi:putative membrane protein